MTAPIRPIPRGLRGFNLIPSPAALASGDPWTYAQAHWDAGEFAYLTGQVDRAAAAGSNCFRLIGSLHAIFAGLVTRAGYLANWQQLARYCQSKGAYFYPAFAGCPDYADASGAVASNDSIVAEVGPWCDGMRSFPNVIGIDLSSEMWTGVESGMVRAGADGTGFSQPISSGTMDALMAGMKAAADAAAPGLSKTFSCFDMGDGNGPFDSPINPAHIFPNCDHLDFHAYVSAPLDSHGVDSVIAVGGGKRIVLGECGSFGDVAAGIADLAPLGPVLSGIMVWQAAGVFDGGATQAAVLAAMGPFAYAPALIPFPRRKRRV